MTILDLLAQRGLSPVKATNMHGGEYVSPCPKCGGSDCFRVWLALNAQDNESGIWFCRRCSQGGDLKKFLQVFGEDSVDETEKKMAITPEELAQLRKLHADATPGPYGFEAHGDTGRYGVGVIMDEYDDNPVTGLNDDPTLFVVDVVASEVNGYQNAAFYAEAYNKFPQLLDALEAAEAETTRLNGELEDQKLQYSAEEKRANVLFGERRAAIRDAANVSYDLVEERKRAEKAEANVARLRERLEAALDKIAKIQDEWESEGVCHACGICAGCPEDWQPTEDHNCRVMLELWADGEPLPWEKAARRAVADAESGGKA